MLTLQSERLLYVPLTSEHAEEFYKMESDPEVLKHYRRGVVKDREESLNNLLVYVKYAMDHQGLGAWSVVDKESGAFIGIGVLIHLNKDTSLIDYEIGYRLPQHQWGKGYATEIAKTLRDYAFKQFNLSQLFGTTHPENVNSQKVLEKVGFKYVGDAIYHGGDSKVYKLMK